MKRKQASTVLADKQAALKKLTDEKITLTGTVESLKERRSNSVISLAGGNEKERKIVLKLEEELAPLLLRLEGLTGLTKRAQGEVDAAQQVLNEITSREEKEIKIYIANKEHEDVEAIRASLPERRKKIVDQYLDICLALGELQIDSFKKLGKTQPLLMEIIDLKDGINLAISEAIKERGLRPIVGAGTQMVSPWGMIACKDSFQVGTGLADMKTIVDSRLEKKQLELREEYLTNNQ